MTGAALPAPIIDTHTHLDDPAFNSDLDVVLKASRSAGVRRFINIGYTPSGWAASRALKDAYDDIDFALGLHPQHAETFSPDLARDLKVAVDKLNPVAIGETGFDFARSGPTFEDQERSFRAQLEIASTTGLPTIIHQREAADALILELDRWPSLAPIVLHSFDGTRRLADWAIERQCYIGIGGLATRNSSSELRSILSTMPVDRLLLETDAPYLAPPGSGNRRNSPVHLAAIAEILAPLWNLSGEELCRSTSANARSVFGLPEVNGS